jgi:probable phosphoglycerate mutase
VSDPTIYRQIAFVAPPGSTTLVIVRHGETEPAIDGQSFPLTDGRGDPPLAANGLVQADQVGARLATEHFDAIYVSALYRTSQTAAPLSKALGLTPFVDPRLSEVFLGDWEGGLLRKKVTERDPVALQMAKEQRWDVIPGAESHEALVARLRAAIEGIAAAHGGGRVAVFCHGGVIGAILAHATGSQPFAFNGSDNGSISELVVTEDRWIVRSYNDTCHLRAH